MDIFCELQGRKGRKGDIKNTAMKKGYYGTKSIKQPQPRIDSSLRGKKWTFFFNILIKRLGKTEVVNNYQRTE